MMLSSEEPAVFGFLKLRRAMQRGGRRSGYHFFMANPVARAGEDGKLFFLAATRRRSTDGRFLQNKAKQNKDVLNF